MSIGQPIFESQAISIGIGVANSFEKLIFCAAGTSIGPIDNVVFPARDPRTIAVTGIREPFSLLQPLGSDAVACNICHFGDEVDFAVIMQDRNLNARTTLSVSCFGDEPAYSTGSSCSTAPLAGIAALIWKNEAGNATKDVVLNKLISASSNPMGDHERFGHGWVNAFNALNN